MSNLAKHLYKEFDILNCGKLKIIFVLQCVLPAVVWRGSAVVGLVGRSKMGKIVHIH